MKSISEDDGSNAPKSLLLQSTAATTTYSEKDTNQRNFDDFDFMCEFEEQDVLELPVSYKNGEVVNLKSFRTQPDKDKFAKPRGVVFYFHGYGSYSQDQAIFAKYLADEGFETFSMDQRGFGESEGRYCIIEKNEDVYNDYWLLIFEAIKKFEID